MPPMMPSRCHNVNKSLNHGKQIALVRELQEEPGVPQRKRIKSSKN